MLNTLRIQAGCARKAELEEGVAQGEGQRTYVQVFSCSIGPPSRGG